MWELLGLIVVTFKYPLLWSILAIWQLHKYHPKVAMVEYIVGLLMVVLLTILLSGYRLEWLYQAEQERLSGMIMWLYVGMGLWFLWHWYRSFYRKKILDRSLSSAYRYFRQPYAIIKAYVDAKPLAHQVMWRRYLRDNQRWQVTLWLMVASYFWLRDFLYFRLLILDAGILIRT